MNLLIKDLLSQLVDIQKGKNWIGTNFDQQLNSLTEDQFFFKTDDLHSVAEIISHLTTWRIETLIKIKTGKGTITDKHPSNWQSNDVLKSLGRNQLLANYRNSLIPIIEILKTKNDLFLNDTYFDTDFKDYYPYRFVIKGMLDHDLYHLGQIGLLKNLMNSRIH